MGKGGKGPQAEKLSQQQCSFQLSLAKPLNTLTQRHSPYSANIGDSMRAFMCLLIAAGSVCERRQEHISTSYISTQKLRVCEWEELKTIGEKKEGRVERGDRESEKERKRKREMSPWCFSVADLLKIQHLFCFFTGSKRASTMNWSLDGDLALCVVVFSSAHLPAQILDNLLARGIPNPTIHPYSLRACVSRHRTAV